MDDQAIKSTDFKFPHQKSLYHGKVRDVYTFRHDTLVSIATDRISAFDVILPRPIPYKGQVLNQLAAHFLQATSGIVPNWLEAVPDPNVSVGRKAEPFKIEMVIRGVLVGHAWREYSSGKRTICDVVMPEEMDEYDPFPQPVITPTTKADAGHDMDISETDILQQGLATPEEWEQLVKYTRALFEAGKEMAFENGLVLADTKYEFGKLDGKIILIDEVHTPDSSRYFYKNSYEDYISGLSTEHPKHLSKEFVREWLIANGFQGQEGQPVPEMTDDFVKMVSDRYIELYELMTSQAFVRTDQTDALERIKTNVINYLEKK